MSVVCLAVRVLIVAACCIAAAGERAAAQVTANADVPQRAFLFGIGLRDAGELSNLWTVSGGAQREVAHAVSAGLVVSHGSRGETACPGVVGTTCITSASVTGVDAQLEFRYGQRAVHPYGVVSLGAAHLRAEPDSLSGWGFAYSPGLGLRARAGPGLWVFAEGRWRQETFGSVQASGAAGTLGLNIGF